MFIIKRPLCLAALGLALVLLCLPADLWIKDPPAERERPPVLTGIICHMEPDGMTVWLTDTNYLDTGIILVSFEAETSFSIGNTILLENNYKIREPETPSNPGQFDARLYYQTKGIGLLCYAREAELVRDDVRPLSQLLYELQKAFSDRIRRLFPEDKSGVLEAMLLGNKTDLEAETRSLYQKSGMSHLLAISGLHVSVFGMSLYRFLRKIGGSLRLSGTAALLAVLLYGGLTGMGTSTCRAVVMFTLLMAGEMLGKSYDMLTALAFGAILLLIRQPLYVRSASFLLSFGAVLGIGLIFPVLKMLFLPKKRNLAKRVEPLLLSLSIQMMTLPALEYFYNEIPLYGILLNLVVIPLMTVVMFAGILALAVSFLSVGAAQAPVFLCTVILELYERLGSFSLGLPGAVFTCGQPRVWQMAAYYIGLAGFLICRYRIGEQKKRRLGRIGDPDLREEEAQKAEPHRRLRQTGSAVGLAMLVVFLTLRLHSGLRLVMLDVGQGDGIYLRTAAGTTILIDGGSTSVTKVGTYRILPFLKTEGVGELDYVVVTHTDEDHISGIKELIEAAGEPGGLRIGTLLLSGRSLEEDKGQRLVEKARENGIAVGRIERGAVLQDDSARLICLHPDAGTGYTDVNVASVVLALSYGDFSVLLTGDLEEAGEQEILEREQKNSEKVWPPDGFTILKAGHHGSKTSSSKAWLGKVKPRLTLISCGKDNSYGHPHKEALERLEAAGSKILQTTECGAIIVESNGKNFQVHAFRKILLTIFQNQ